MTVALVVDDEESLRCLTREVCEAFGLQVYEAGDGVEGEERFMAHPDIDLVIFDGKMPRCGGREFHARVHGVRPARYIHMTTLITGELREYCARYNIELVDKLGDVPFMRRIGEILGKLATAAA